MNDNNIHESINGADNNPGTQQRVQAKDSYILRKVAGSHVLISVGENIANFNGYIQLNETAAFLWQQMKEPKTAKELAAAVSGEFDVPFDEAYADVLELLEEVKSKQMVNVL